MRERRIDVLFSPGMRAPFEVLEPTGPETPVVVEVPHAGLDLPPPFLEPLAAPARALGRDADLYVDALYESAPAEGASMLVARASRYVLDLNRAEGDVDGEVVEGGRADVQMHHGLVWRTTSDGEPALARKLRPDELEERLELVWRPYHRALAALIARKHDRFGVAVVLAAHSMPSVERVGRNAMAQRGAALDGWGQREIDRSREAGSARPADAPARADVVPGTRGRRSASARFIDAVEAHAAASGWTVRHDDPYAGGFTTQHYGRPVDGVHAVQVELARRLYLDETTLRPNHNFSAARTWCRELVGRLGRLALTP
ncbi:MAG: N-formylglutamate amidohydrolase [Myxococcota bacterium]|nr:N-formylglutamate amidohydrolase [Myxococcota bacterium]